MKNQIKIIEATKKSSLIDLRELMRFRDLFITLTWRDFRVRYAQTTIGVLWALVQPLFILIILSIVFTKVVVVEVDIPYLIFAMSGLCLWNYFSFVLLNAGGSIIASQGMVKKIYFPRLIIPLSKAAVGLIDLIIAMVLLVTLMFYYRLAPVGPIYFAPFFVLFAIIASLAAGIWLSALTVRYRDFQYVVPFLVQIGLYATPVFYPSSMIIKNWPDWLTSLYFMNPLTGVIEGFRWSFFGGQLPLNYILVSFLTCLLLFFFGLYYFKSIEEEMADFV